MFLCFHVKHYIKTCFLVFSPFSAYFYIKVYTASGWKTYRDEAILTAGILSQLTQ